MPTHPGSSIEVLNNISPSYPPLEDTKLLLDLLSYFALVYTLVLFPFFFCFVIKRGDCVVMLTLAVLEGFGGVVGVSF